MTRLPHDEAGEGHPVVLLHAGIADRRMWADLLPAIADAGHRAIAVDLPGFGEAADPRADPISAVLETMEARHLAPLEAPSAFRDLILDWLKGAGAGPDSPPQR